MRLLDGINDTEDELYTFNSIMETKTVKGLEAIQEYKRVVCPNCQYTDEEKCNVVCFSNIIEKELKALEIIKTKCSPLLKQYLLDLLPKEESELVREVLDGK